MKFAVIKSGGKQYLVEKGDVLDVEKLEKEAKDTIEFEEVLMIADDKDIKFGSPMIEGAKVKAEVVQEYKDKKVIGIKYKAKKRQRKKFGHRQQYTQVKILEV
ncbi:50S ribosomal protein L21 [Patescibacteria group bacterium]|nr:50S ribosomal protein L21 [Patescibacteria group bacterium]